MRVFAPRKKRPPHDGTSGKICRAFFPKIARINRWGVPVDLSIRN
jgi:hypothetical protein